MLRIFIIAVVLSTAAKSTLAVARADSESSVNAINNRGDASRQFSLLANQALTNLSTQMAQFQRMISVRSSQLQNDLQGKETANDEIEEANTRIQASNMKLEADNHALERRARALANANKKLRNDLNNLEDQLQTARSLAAAVDSFASKDTSKEAEEGSGVDTALLAISAETEALAEGTRSLVQQEKLSVSNLQHSYEGAVVTVKQHQTQLLEAQAHLNTTHTQLVARRGHLMKLLAKLQAAHNHMQRRAQKLGAFLRQLAGIAAHPQVVPKPQVQQGAPSTKGAQAKAEDASAEASGDEQAATDQQTAAQRPQTVAEPPQPQQQQPQQQAPAKPRSAPRQQSTNAALQVGHKHKQKLKAKAESDQNASLLFDSVLNQLHR